MKNVRSLLFIAFISLAVPAWSASPFIEIDDAGIKRKIEQEVPVIMANHPEWKLENLLRQCTRELPDGMNREFARQKPNDRTLSGDETYARCSEAIVMFGKYYNCGHCSKMHTNLIASATMLSSDGICLTNYHVLKDIIENNAGALKGDSLYFVANREGKCYPVTHIFAYSKETDIAIFKIDARGEKLACLPLGNPVNTGSKVRLISSPQGILYFYTEGVVTKNSLYSDDGVERRSMQISADFAAGSSGAGIVDEYGNLAGMVVSTQSIYYNPERQSNLQMVVKNIAPASEIRKVLEL